MRTSNEDQFRDTKLSKLRNVKMENCERVKQLSLVSTIPLFSAMLILFFTNSYTVICLICCVRPNISLFLAQIFIEVFFSLFNLHV